MCRDPISALVERFLAVTCALCLAEVVIVRSTGVPAEVWLEHILSHIGRDVRNGRLLRATRTHSPLCVIQVDSGSIYARHREKAMHAMGRTLESVLVSHNVAQKVAPQ